MTPNGRFDAEAIKQRVSIEQVFVGKRIRKELGDISA